MFLFFLVANGLSYFAEFPHMIDCVNILVDLVIDCLFVYPDKVTDYVFTHPVIYLYLSSL